jgi:cephalosporin-C deacetylase-like acetyl esterase
MKHAWLVLVPAGCLAESARLMPTEPGVPESMGGEVVVSRCGAGVCVGARLPEFSGRVLARSMGRNPVWERDAVESPELEDRVRIELEGEGKRAWAEVNPWAAHRSEGLASIAPTARIDRDGWAVEAVLHAAFRVREVRVERIRPRRALAPEYRWSATIAAPTESRPEPQAAKPEEVFPIGALHAIPKIDAEWDDPAWAGATEIELARNEPYPRASRYSTKVKVAYYGARLMVLFRADEPEPVVARAGGRDSAVTGDDHVAIYLATSGSAFLELAINSVGALRDARGRGPHIMRPDSSWNPAVDRWTDIRHGYWIARIDVPLSECASALGESGVPDQWRMLLSRLRAARPGEAGEQSAFPVVGGATTFYGPARYRVVQLVKGPGRRFATDAVPMVDGDAWTPFERRSRSARSMLSRYLDGRLQQAVMAERAAWDTVRTREDWERFRDQRIAALRRSMGEFPPDRPPLSPVVSARHRGRGYRLENVAFQGRRDSWITANVYLPESAPSPMPAIIIVHSQHFPKTQGELHDMGELWARAGAMVLVMERPGYGERVDTTPWYRQSYASRHNFTKQLFLVGESYSGWAAWDIIRAVDYLHTRPEADRDRIVLLGSVAGGGEPSAVAAALDPRIAAVAPFNYDQGHVRVHGDSPRQIADHFSPWLVAASVAPRRFIRAFEFGWEGAEEPDYANFWVDGMERSRKVWGFYGALDNLASSRGYGLIRLSMERVSHCFSIGPQQREDLYPLLQRWFGIAMPEAADRAILPDSALSVSPQREEARRQEAARRRPHADLVSITPQVNATLRRRTMNAIARDLIRRDTSDIAPLLGDIEPAAPQARLHWKRANREAHSIAVEPGIDVPLLVVRPASAAPAPVVVAVAQGGKSRFLSNRSAEINRLVAAGVAVVLADVRGTGETAAAQDGTPLSLAQAEFDLGRNLLGSRLKDLRTVLAWVRAQPGVDPQRIAVWGESFSPPNPPSLAVDELEFEVAPQVQFKADPLGAHLALLAGRFEPSLAAVVARGGLVSYASMLDDPFTYAPMDVVVHGILRRTDLSEIEAAVRCPVLRDSRVTGRNIAVDGPPADAARWLIDKLAK